MSSGPRAPLHLPTGLSRLERERETPPQAGSGGGLGAHLPGLLCQLPPHQRPLRFSCRKFMGKRCLGGLWLHGCPLPLPVLPLETARQGGRRGPEELPVARPLPGGESPVYGAFPFECWTVPLPRCPSQPLPPHCPAKDWTGRWLTEGFRGPGLPTSGCVCVCVSASRERQPEGRRVFPGSSLLPTWQKGLLPASPGARTQSRQIFVLMGGVLQRSSGGALLPEPSREVPCGVCKVAGREF